ncbi:MAG: DegT/DnrJ/EryC1/StrS family aminotransferase, partial [Candidatus Hodarchaeales archaeon]
MFILALPRTKIQMNNKDLLRMIVPSSTDHESEFIRSFKDHFKYKNAIAFPSARISLFQGLRSLGIKKWDEIITTTYTDSIVPAVIKSLGAEPIFVDIDAETYNMNPDEIQGKITDKTKAVICTHLFGQPCDIGEISELCEQNGLFMVEDCAQAIGAKYKKKSVGSFGDISIFSFDIGK